MVSLRFFAENGVCEAERRTMFRVFIQILPHIYTDLA